MSTFSTCFYFFAGFEIFSTAGQNVENPNRNIGLGVTLIMIISTIFYVIIMVFFFCSIAPGDFSQNASMSAWNT
jgi:amino acid transporter